MTTFAVSDIQADKPRPSKRELFWGFMQLSMIAFGGVLPLARRMLVEQRRWLTSEEFTEVLGLCQFLPGGNIINLSVAVGMRFRGPAGACVALLGLITVPTIVVVMLGVVYDRYRDDPHIQHLFAGLAAAAAGLMIAMGLKMAKALRGNLLGMLVALLSFVVIALVRVPLLYGMVALTLIGIAVAAWRHRS
jgi:chromate transporter